MKQLIPRITPEMLRNQPDQACDTINRAIDAINELIAKSN